MFLLSARMLEEEVRVRFDNNVQNIVSLKECMFVDKRTKCLNASGYDCSAVMEVTIISVEDEYGHELSPQKTKLITQRVQKKLGHGKVVCDAHYPNFLKDQRDVKGWTIQ